MNPFRPIRFILAEFLLSGGKPLGKGATAEVVAGKARGIPVAAKTLFAFDKDEFTYSREWVVKLAATVDAELQGICAVPPHASILAPTGVVRKTFQREGEAPVPNIPKYVLYPKCAGSLGQTMNRLALLLFVSDALEILEQIGFAITHAHAHNIVHRDIKPLNIMVASGGRYLLGDFGEYAVTEKTKTMTAAGSPLYMAPEMCQGLVDGKTQYGQKVDWWSLGVVCLDLLDKVFFGKQRNLADALHDGGKPKTTQAAIDGIVQPMLNEILQRDIPASDVKCRQQLATATTKLLRLEPNERLLLL